jgi:hypothetical protein
MRIRNYVKLAAPEPEILRIAGAQARRNGTSTLTSRQVDQIIHGGRLIGNKKGHHRARIRDPRCPSSDSVTRK